MKPLLPFWTLGALALLAPAASGQEAAPAAPLSARLVIHADQPQGVINRNLYGNFSEHLGHDIYGGFWVGPDSPIPNTRGIRNDIVAALRAMRLPVLRWPGGCFADEYHWRDGVGPRDRRPKMINTNWGGVVETNAFGTHEFMDLCEQIGAEPYVCGNVGSGTVQEMKDWIEYMTSDADSPMANLRRQNGRNQPWTLKYFGVGNEAWGCGGHMTPEFYADNFERYNAFVKNLSGNVIARFASGPNSADYHWTETLMQRAAGQMNGLTLHYYTTPQERTKTQRLRGSATDFDEAAWHETLRKTLVMEDLITRHAALMDRYDPAKKVGLVVDEWGTWYDVEPGTNPGFLYQQNSLRDALVAGINLNLFNRHCDRVTMANLAQSINVLQALVLTDGPRMLLTPTYHVFAMYQVHQGATLLPADLTTPDYTLAGRSIPAVTVSASRDTAGKIHVSFCNLDPRHSVGVACELTGASFGAVNGQVLSAPLITSHNTFEQPDAVHPAAFTGFRRSGDALNVELPAKSVVVLEL